MVDMIRDAPIGQILRQLSRNRLLQYPEETASFNPPRPGADLMCSSHHAAPGMATSRVHPFCGDNEGTQKDVEDGRQPVIPPTANEWGNGNVGESDSAIPKDMRDAAILVGWYGPDDPENPQNWSGCKRFFVSLIICVYTFVVYTSSAIYTTSLEGIMSEFGVSRVQATLGLSLYVLGYGVGPLVFSPLSEIPRIGRSPVYAVSMFLFVIISIPTAFANSFPGLMVLRFLQGFFGSPCLASGGASLGDFYSVTAVPYAMTAWVSAAYCGRKFSLFSTFPRCRFHSHPPTLGMQQH